jgi:FMN phosphatase YigB (HAD superfamily)
VRRKELLFICFSLFLSIEETFIKMLYHSKDMKTILVDAINCFVIEKEGAFQVFAEMHDLLECYPHKKIILTGANAEQSIKFGLDKMPYEVFTLSHDPEKTDPSYFKIMLQKFNLDASDVIYFEHSMDAMKSAQSIGVSTFYYDNDKKDLAELKKFLDDNL